MLWRATDDDDDDDDAFVLCAIMKWWSQATILAAIFHVFHSWWFPW